MACVLDAVSSCKGSVDSCIDKKDPTLQVITWLFFRIVGLFFPLIFALELGWNLYQLNRINSGQEALKEENNGLNNRIRQMVAADQANQVAAERLGWELDTAATERDAARAERDEKTAGRARLVREREELQGATEQLRAELADALAKQMAADQAVKEQIALVQNLRDELQQQGHNRALLDQMKATIDQNQLAPGTTSSEKEFAKLLPFYDQHKAEFVAMMQKKMDSLPADDPIRVTTKGIIDLANDYWEHIQTFRKELRFQDGVRESVLDLVKELL